jgi:short-subunit dehydrogenase
LNSQYGEKIIAISKDLTDTISINGLKTMLEDENPIISYLVNSAGIAKMGNYNDFSIEEIKNTIMINCFTIVSLSTICIPYMLKGSHIINLSSASAFQPLPYINLYASTKVFDRHYSRALNMELKDKGISVTAVCPSWVDTELLKKEVNGRKIKFQGIVTAEQVVTKAIKDAKKGNDMSVYSLYVKYLHVLAKLFPQNISMNTWIRGIKKYL